MTECGMQIVKTCAIGGSVLGKVKWCGDQYSTAESQDVDQQVTEVGQSVF